MWWWRSREGAVNVWTYENRDEDRSWSLEMQTLEQRGCYSCIECESSQPMIWVESFAPLEVFSPVSYGLAISLFSSCGRERNEWMKILIQGTTYSPVVTIWINDLVCFYCDLFWNGSRQSALFLSSRATRLCLSCSVCCISQRFLSFHSFCMFSFVVNFWFVSATATVQQVTATVTIWVNEYWFDCDLFSKDSWQYALFHSARATLFFSLCSVCFVSLLSHFSFVSFVFSCSPSS